MRRIYLYVVCALSVVLLPSCVSDEADSREPMRIAQTIWYEAKADLDYVNRMLTDAVHFDHMLTIEDDSLRDTYFDIYFGQRSELDERANGYVVKRMSNYDLPIYIYYITNKCALGDGEWTVRYEGGNDYTMTLTPQEDGTIMADITTLYIDESSGEASLRFKYDVSELDDRCNAEAEVEYEGYVELVDKSASASRPLTLRSQTKMPVTISDRYEFSFRSGQIEIDCHDAYYGSHDKVDVSFSSDPQGYTLKYRGQSKSYY